MMPWSILKDDWELSQYPMLVHSISCEATEDIFRLVARAWLVSLADIALIMQEITAKVGTSGRLESTTARERKLASSLKYVSMSSGMVRRARSRLLRYKPQATLSMHMFSLQIYYLE